MFAGVKTNSGSSAGSVQETRKVNERITGHHYYKHERSCEQISLPFFGKTHLNLVVTLLSIAAIWTFIIACCVAPESVPLDEWKHWVIKYFSWLFIGAPNMFGISLVLIYFSKYADLKLGQADDQPEYGDLSWFFMIFSCGIGADVFYFGVSEPLTHYISANKYTSDPTTTDNVIAQKAVNMTVFHWAIHSWVMYGIVGLLLSILTHRQGLPNIMASGLHPLIGEKSRGFIGDFVNALSIVTTLFGICAGLVIGTRQLNSGLHFYFEQIPQKSLVIQVAIIWSVTFFATVSTVSGIGKGIKRVSEACLVTGTLVLFTVFLLADASYLLSLLAQTVGSFFSDLVKLTFDTDAFGQLGDTAAGGQGDRRRWRPEGFDETHKASEWMEEWTVFLWAWWVAWTPFVGLFIAKISKGRTIRQLLRGLLLAPAFYLCVWMVCLGGTGLQKERQAAKAGLCCPNKSGWFQRPDQLRQMLSNRSMLHDIIDPATSNLMCEDGHCGDCAVSILAEKHRLNETYLDLVQDYQNGGSDFGRASIDRSLVRLSCYPREIMLFYVMNSFGPIGSLLAVLCFVGVVLFYVTSSDSGSLVMDYLCANDDPDPPKLRRAFWSLTQGAATMALILVDGEHQMTAYQSATIICSLPLALIDVLVCVALWKMLRITSGEAGETEEGYV